MQRPTLPLLDDNKPYEYYLYPTVMTEIIDFVYIHSIYDYIYYSIIYSSSTMVGTRRNPRSTAPSPPPMCQHCGLTGHISDLCSRSHYSSSMPAFSCSNCLKEIVSCNSSDPARFDVSVRIINCAAHKTTTARPPPPPSTGSTARPPASSTGSRPVTSAVTSTTSPPDTTASGAASSSTPPYPPPPYTADQSAPAVQQPPAPHPPTGQRIPPALLRRGTRTRVPLPLEVYTDLYSSVVDTTQRTSCGLYEALNTNNIKRGFWRNVRPIAEALLVDPIRYREALRTLGSSLNLKRAKMEAAAVLNTTAGKQKLRTLHLDGVTLVPLAQY